MTSIGPLADGLVNNDTVVSAVLTSTGAVATATVAGSPYAIVVSAAMGSGLANYTISYTNGSLTVNKAILTITADDQTKITGEANPPFTVSYSGFVLGQDRSVLDGALIFSTPATTSSPPGAYPITPSGLTSSNYAITFVSGTLGVGTTSTELSPDCNPAVAGQTVTFVVSVGAEAAQSAQPSGLVTFMDGAATLAPPRSTPAVSPASASRL
jgi:hypothetical protein